MAPVSEEGNADAGIRPVGDHPDDQAYREEIQGSVADVLGRWGRSLDREPYEALPEHTWEQILAGVSAEQHRQGSGRRRILPGGRWTTPLVAASVVALALVLANTVIDRSGGDAPVVASDQTTTEMAATDSAAGSSGDAPAATSPNPQIVQAGFVPPARKVMALPESISSDNIASTVDEILEASGVDEPTDVLDMPEETWQPTPGGMTADAQTLRNCVTKVTKVATSQALLVLRANVNGLDAGLIVVPEFMVDMNKMKGMDSEAMRRMGRQMGVTKVYVVEPTCGMGAPDHDPTMLQVAFTLAP